MQAREGDDAHRQLKNVPEHTVRLVAETRLPFAVEATLVGRHLSGRSLDDAHRFPLADASLLDLRLRRQLGAWEVWFDGRNLLDESFLWVGYALPDLAGGQVPYGYPGHSRAWTLGVRWAQAPRR